MQIRIKRRFKATDYTIGSLFIDGKYFCDTLEDKVRDLRFDGSGKVYGKTAIPSGEYKVTLTLSNRFKKVLPLLHDVPFFEGIRIHSGNTDKDTDGCLLVGENREKGKVLFSRPTMERLMKRMRDAESRGEDITISIS